MGGVGEGCGGGALRPARPFSRFFFQSRARKRARSRVFFNLDPSPLPSLSPTSCADITVPAHGRAIVPTGLALAAPPGTYARVAPRSGLAVKHFIDTGAGVVDEDYRGEVGVVLFNHGGDAFEVRRGDRVAQLILERIVTPEVEEVDDLDATARGAGGYGSTGVASSK